MTRLALFTATVCGGLWAAEAARVKINQEQVQPGVMGDPFADLLPPMQGDPLYAQAARNDPQQQTDAVPTIMAEERILTSEALLDEQVELNQEERMEVECVGMEHLREVTDYIPEQDEADQEIRNMRHFTPTEAEHKCLPLHRRNKKMPARLFSGAGMFSYVNPPAFPERLGEIVVEEVFHKDAQPGKHIVLEMKGCTSCQNDYEDFVEWGGLLAIDETGSYRKMYLADKTDNFKKGHWSMGNRENIVEAPRSRGPPYPRQFTNDPNFVRRSKQKFLKKYKYKYSSYKFDESILPEVETMAKESLQTNGSGAGVNADFVHAHQAEEVKILHDLRSQEKHLPFNHKLEEMWMNVYVCTEANGGLSCPQTPDETLIVHDGALMFDSANTALFDQLGKSAGVCAYGPCGGRHPRMKDGTPFTMCSGCSSHSRCGTQSRAYPAPSMGSQGMFNCLVERVNMPNGPVDKLMQRESSLDAKARISSGLFLSAASGSVGHIQGHVNWHLTVPRAGHCEPFLQDVAYIGVGVDECDKCQSDEGAVDVDVGLLLLSCDPGHTKKLGGTNGNCRYYHHLNYAQQRAKNNFYAISEDDRGGEGEGDDEWVFLNLAALKDEGVTHAVIMSNIFGCKSGRPTSEIGWQDLEGAFARVTGSSSDQKTFENAETIGYIDLDGMTGPSKDGAGLIMFYLSDDTNLAEPKEMGRSDAAMGSGKHWRMVVAKAPFNGRSMTSAGAQQALSQFGLGLLTVPESTAGEQIEDMELPTLMATEQTSAATGHVMEEFTPVIVGGMEDANTYHPSGETSAERQAKAMDNVDMWKKLTITLPEGPPGTDTICAKGHEGPRK